MKVITTSIQTWQAKLAGILLITTSFNSSCTDPSDIGLVLDPNANQIGVFYAEIPLSASLVSVDSLRTTNPLVLVVGGDNSDYFGRTEAIGYSRMAFSSTATKPTTDAILDSARFSISISSLTAEGLDQAKNFSAHKLTEPILDTAYYSFDHLSYEEAPFASGSFMLTENSDTIVAMNLDETLAADLFSKLQNEDAIFDNIFNFRDYFPGFALKGNPDEETTINVLVGNDTGIKLYFRESEEDTVSSTYTIFTAQSRHFNGVLNDPTGTPTEVIVENDEAYDVGNLAGSKSLLGLVLRLDMEPLSNFLDTLENATFNQATLVMGPTENFADSKLPPQSLIPYFTDESNQILTRESDGALYSIQSDVATQVVIDEDGNVLPAVSTSGTNPLLFDSEKFIYQQSLTSYVDALFRTDVQRYDLLLYPRTPSSGGTPPYSNDFVRSLREYVVNQNSIKLKIYYSKMR
ncbi:DUF4270 family protein [Echinicola sp. CAU 1574]|uniref:DUF4270 family protein n=1 Tax=Echinicola arenosa TaxID=2774144 RepID=A0ABR9AQI0_9BACT|nr:DUF4270 family protein [Echinicola arenosa]MBD8491048.1 DUF4270 family protein [Echinicola arenosa]